MEEIIYEVIVGAIILGVILVVIAMFRNGVGSIRDTVKSQADLEMTNEYEMLCQTGAVYSGSKVQEAYSYSQIASDDMQIWVVNGSTKTLVTSEAQASSLAPSGNRYKVEVVFLTRPQSNFVYDADTVTEYSAGNYAQVRFTFTRQ